MSFLGLITVRHHEILLADAQAAYPAFQFDVEKYHRMYLDAKARSEAETLRADGLADEVAVLRADAMAAAMAVAHCEMAETCG